MTPDPVVAAIPAYVVLIAAEVLAARNLGRKVHRLPDSVSSIGTGVLGQDGGGRQAG